MIRVGDLGVVILCNDLQQPRVVSLLLLLQCLFQEIVVQNPMCKLHLGLSSYNRLKVGLLFQCNIIQCK